MLQSISSESMRNSHTYASFKTLYDNNPSKVGYWLNHALVVKQKSDEMYTYIENFKRDIIKLGYGKDKSVTDLKEMDNLNVAGEYAITRRNGEILKKKITEYKKFLQASVSGDTAKIKMFENNFSTNREKGVDGRNWEELLFENMPVAAVTTILTKYESDVRIAEGEVVQYLMAQTDVGDYRVNSLRAFVIPVSTYVMAGDKYSATIVLSAIDSTKTPIITANGRTLAKDGKYEMLCNQIGSFDYSGSISLTYGGYNRNYPFKSSYTVGAKSATVTNTALNVVYAGIDNELSASVPGVAAANVQLTCGGATISRKPSGLWNCHPNVTSGKITFSISAKMAGATGFVPMGSVTYNVRQLPDPRPFLAYSVNGVEKSVTDGSITLGQLNGGVMKADYVNELISANFTVTSFMLEFPNGEVIETSGSTLSGTQKNRLSQERVGSRILIRGIKAVGPDRLVRSLPLLAVKLSGR